jgi:hypothetical protein
MWTPSRRQAEIQFDTRGRATVIDSVNPDGSVLRQTRLYGTDDRLLEEQYSRDDRLEAKRIFAYDSDGRRTETREVKPDGTESVVERYAYDDGQIEKDLLFDVSADSSVGFGCGTSTDGAPGDAGPGLWTVSVGEDSVDKLVVHNAAGRVIATVLFTRDDRGRVVKEELHHGTPGGISTFLDRVPPDERDSAAALFDAVMPDRTVATITHVYDSRGLLVATKRRFGILSEESSEFTYDDRGNPVLERSVTTGGQASLNGQGQIQITPEKTRVREIRFDYRYDDHGNWIERIVSAGLDEEVPSQSANAERRTIVYYFNESGLPGPPA